MFFRRKSLISVEYHSHWYWWKKSSLQEAAWLEHDIDGALLVVTSSYHSGSGMSCVNGKPSLEDVLSPPAILAFPLTLEALPSSFFEQVTLMDTKVKHQVQVP